MSDPVDAAPALALAERPLPGPHREYHFPAFQRETLANGLRLIRAHVPGRPLLVAQLLVHGEGSIGAAGEAATQGGVTVLMARAMTEGTLQRDAVALIEASERLGAELSADAGWDTLSASVEVPRSKLAPALSLLAEVALEPSFPEGEIERLREERINDLLQARADPRRRVERLFPELVFAEGVPYRRPLAGTEETVPGIDRAAIAARHAALLDPASSTLVVAGELTGIALRDEVEAVFGGWRGPGGPGTAVAAAAKAVSRGAPAPRIVVVDRPGAPQSELRVGHLGVPRLNPDFHALSVLNAILGGLFNSRLNQLLRETRGYTYGINSSFDMRRAAGPFVVRCAVQTAVTVPALLDVMSELKRIREAPVSEEELDAARQYLVGVFPLRFETAGQVAGAIGGLVAMGLPDDELDRYRPAIAAVTAEEVLRVAQERIRPADASVAIVGDADQFEAALGDAGLGVVTVIRGEEVGEEE
jgi:zinc protease